MMDSVATAATTTKSAAQLSAVIVTLNEADRIVACIERLKFCDEILVVDAHSTDGTRELAAAAGARVIERDWPGYRSQKDFAVQAAAHDWVLCVDADERVSPQLRAEIEDLRARGFPKHAGWEMPFALHYFGKFLRHGTKYPDRHLRLLDRRRGGWRGREIHEHIEVDGSVGRLRGDIEHFAYRDLAHQRIKLEKYAELMAQELHARGKRAGIFKVLFRPWWRFFSGYVLRAGFLDGWRGLFLALLEANYVRLKYIRLFLLRRGLEK
jgi:glycosyltransferase involved in cell wall biosynthesis